MLVREFWVGALRDLMLEKITLMQPKLLFLLKLKHLIQFITFIVLLSGLHLNNSIIILIGNFILFASLIVTLQTGLEYTVKTFKNLNAKS